MSNSPSNYTPYVSSAVLSGSGDTVLTNQTTSTTSYTNLATTGPQVTITTGTSALVFMSCYCANQSGTGFSAFISVDVSGASSIAASDSNSTETSQNTGTAFAQTLFLVVKITGLTPGNNVFTMKYKVDGQTWAFVNRSMFVLPL